MNFSPRSRPPTSPPAGSARASIKSADGRPLPQEWKPWIAAVDVPVVFCRFTQDLVAAATGKPPELIYHGVDTKRFKPMDKPIAKKLANVAGRFVVGTVARNQQRKNLPALLKALPSSRKTRAMRCFTCTRRCGPSGI